jgi:signal peptidase I
VLKLSKARKPKKEQPPFFSWESLKSFGILLAIIFAIRWSVVSPYFVPTASMEPTIKVGDRLLANKLAYNLKVPFSNYVIARWAEVKRGDIIVFRFPNDPSIDYVKRVVAVGGDRIRLQDDVLYINDEPQERVDFNQRREILSDIQDNRDPKLLFRERLNGVLHWTINTAPEARFAMRGTWPDSGYITVPAGSVYTIGDNRDNSYDSREWGRVPLENIHGKAVVVLWSAYFPRDSFWPVVRFSRFGHILDGDVTE